MQHTQKIFKTIRFICLLAVTIIGLATIIGTGGGSGNGSDDSSYNDNGTDNVNGNAVTEGDYNNSIGMTFNYIEPGTFMMGSPSDEPGRLSFENQHQVTLTQGYHMQTTPVTQGQWEAVMGDNPSYFFACGSNCPVDSCPSGKRA